MFQQPTVIIILGLFNIIYTTILVSRIIFSFTIIYFLPSYIPMFVIFIYCFMSFGYLTIRIAIHFQYITGLITFIFRTVLFILIHPAFGK